MFGFDFLRGYSYEEFNKYFLEEHEEIAALTSEKVRALGMW